MPVYRLLEEMPYEELLKWQAYFEKRPEGWREDNRTYTLLRVQGVKAGPAEIFSSLIPIFKATNQSPEGFVSSSNLKGSFMFHKMQEATGGENILGLFNAQDSGEGDQRGPAAVG